MSRRPNPKPPPRAAIGGPLLLGAPMPDHEPDRRDYSSLAAAIGSAIREEMAKLTVPEEIHREHHAFVAEWLEQQRRKRERAEKIKAQVGGGQSSLYWGVSASLATTPFCISRSI